LLAIPLPELQYAENQRVEEGFYEHKMDALWHLIQPGKEKTQKGLNHEFSLSWRAWFMAALMQMQATSLRASRF